MAIIKLKYVYHIEEMPGCPDGAWWVCGQRKLMSGKMYDSAPTYFARGITTKDAAQNIRNELNRLSDIIGFIRE